MQERASCRRWIWALPAGYPIVHTCFACSCAMVGSGVCVAVLSIGSWKSMGLPDKFGIVVSVLQ